MVPPLSARPAWRGLPVGPTGRWGRPPLTESLVSQTLIRSQSRLRSKCTLSLPIVDVQLSALDITLCRAPCIQSAGRRPQWNPPCVWSTHAEKHDRSSPRGPTLRRERTHPSTQTAGLCTHSSSAPTMCRCHTGSLLQLSVHGPHSTVSRTHP